MPLRPGEQGYRQNIFEQFGSMMNASSPMWRNARRLQQQRVNRYYAQQHRIAAQGIANPTGTAAGRLSAAAPQGSPAMLPSQQGPMQSGRTNAEMVQHLMARGVVPPAQAATVLQGFNTGQLKRLHDYNPERIRAGDPGSLAGPVAPNMEALGAMWKGRADAAKSRADVAENRLRALRGLPPIPTTPVAEEDVGPTGLSPAIAGKEAVLARARAAGNMEAMTPEDRAALGPTMRDRFIEKAIQEEIKGSAAEGLSPPSPEDLATVSRQGEAKWRGIFPYGGNLSVGRRDVQGKYITDPVIAERFKAQQAARRGVNPDGSPRTWEQIQASRHENRIASRMQQAKMRQFTQAGVPPTTAMAMLMPGGDDSFLRNSMIFGPEVEIQRMQEERLGAQSRAEELAALRDTAAGYAESRGIPVPQAFNELSALGTGAPSTPSRDWLAAVKSEDEFRKAIMSRIGTSEEMPLEEAEELGKRRYGPRFRLKKRTWSEWLSGSRR